MKKLLSLAVITTVFVSTSLGCSPSPAEPTSNQTNPILKDGTYHVVGSMSQTGWTPELTMVVENKKISDVKYEETAAMKKSQYIEYQRNFKSQSKLELPAIYSSLEKSLMTSHNPKNIDVIAGATRTSASFKALAAEALTQAKDSDKYKDGEYQAVGKEDEKSWTPRLTITMKDNKIAAVKYDEISSKVFKNKSMDRSYISAYKEKNNLDVPTVYSTLQKTLVEKQDPTKIDIIAGATETSKSFAELAARAMEEAK